MRKTRLISACLGSILSLLVTMLLVHSCGIYSFSGSSIDYTSVKTITINYFEYKALKVNPSLSNNLTAVKTCKRTDINKVIGCSHGLLIVFYDNHRIAHISQHSKSVYQLLVITLMQSYRRFIKDIQHSLQS